MPSAAAAAERAGRCHWQRAFVGSAALVGAADAACDVWLRLLCSAAAAAAAAIATAACRCGSCCCCCCCRCGCCCCCSTGCCDSTRRAWLFRESVFEQDASASWQGSAGWPGGAGPTRLSQLRVMERAAHWRAREPPSARPSVPIRREEEEPRWSGTRAACALFAAAGPTGTSAGAASLGLRLVARSLGLRGLRREYLLELVTELGVLRRAAAQAARADGWVHATCTSAGGSVSISRVPRAPSTAAQAATRVVSRRVLGARSRADGASLAREGNACVRACVRARPFSPPSCVVPAATHRLDSLDRPAVRAEAEEQQPSRDQVVLRLGHLGLELQLRAGRRAPRRVLLRRRAPRRRLRRRLRARRAARGRGAAVAAAQRPPRGAARQSQQAQRGASHPEEFCAAPCSLAACPSLSTLRSLRLR